MPPSLFVPDGDRFVPTDFSRGPWSPDALHGGPPAALLARAVERVEGGAEFFVSRLTVELLRPVPVEPLAVEARLVRPGRKVQLVEASLSTKKHEVCRVSGLRIRKKTLELPALENEAPPAPLPEGTTREVHAAVFGNGFHDRAVEHRFVKGSFVDRGPSIDWMRLLVPLLPGEPASPLGRVAALADFGNGISSVLPHSYTYINPDLTVSLGGYPRGEWVCLDATSRIAPYGVGVAESRIYDENGRIGTAIQHLIVDLRDE